MFSPEQWVLPLELLGQQQLVMHDHVREQAECAEHTGHSLHDGAQSGKKAVVAFRNSGVPEEPFLSSVVDFPQKGVVSSLWVTELPTVPLRVCSEVEPDAGGTRCHSSDDRQ